MDNVTKQGKITPHYKGTYLHGVKPIGKLSVYSNLNKGKKPLIFMSIFVNTFTKHTCM